MASLIAPLNCSPQEDAQALRDAVKGWGTDEKALIEILCHRNVFQRQEIREAYEQLHGEDLIKRLESELSGDFERAMYRWTLPLGESYAVFANAAIRNGKEDYNVIVEISCVLQPNKLLIAKCGYHERYKRSLEEDVAAHTSGHLRQLLVGLVGTYRYGEDEINARLARTEADILHEAIKNKKDNHEEVIRILSTRSKAQLMATFNSYRDQYGISITKKLLDEGSDNFLKAVYVAIRCLTDPKKYYEKVLRNAIKRIGTDEDALTRVFVTRAENDLKDIAELYYKKNSVQLEDAVASDTSGDYKRMLLTLLGKY